jgi:NTP pyrophosphatase (non-canonical NTP hydrolase)
MNPSKFLETVDILENKDFKKLIERMSDPVNLRLMHASIGVGTETGELQDLFKKKVLYGKEVEVSKFVDEIGDILWYLGVACNTLGVSFDEVMEKNWKKLSTRYGDKLQFTEEAALNKDKNKEWQAMNNDKVEKSQGS